MQWFLAIFSTGTYEGIGMVRRVWKCYEKCQKNAFNYTTLALFGSSEDG